jgi:hypothetical protein
MAKIFGDVRIDLKKRQILPALTEHARNKNIDPAILLQNLLEELMNDDKKGLSEKTIETYLLENGSERVVDLLNGVTLEKKMQSTT